MPAATAPFPSLADAADGTCTGAAQHTGTAVFELPLRVYWEDTDGGGIVYYANYLKFFERARTEWLRGLGVQQAALKQSTGALFVVSQATVQYLAPALLDDLLRVTVQVQRVGAASLHLAQAAWRADQLLARAEVRVGCIDHGTFKPRRIPSHVLQLLT